MGHGNVVNQLIPVVSLKETKERSWVFVFLPGTHTQRERERESEREKKREDRIGKDRKNCPRVRQWVRT